MLLSSGFPLQGFQRWGFGLHKRGIVVVPNPVLCNKPQRVSVQGNRFPGSTEMFRTSVKVTFSILDVSQL